MRHFAIGITLDSLELYPCNSKWERQFIEKSQKVRLEAIRKQIIITNLAIYFNSQTQLIFSDLSDYRKIDLLHEMILNDDCVPKELDYIVKSSAILRLVEKNPKDELVALDPKYTVSLDLESLMVSITRMQIEDIIKFAEFLNQYKQYKIKCEREKEKEEMLNLTQEDMTTYLDEFKLLYEKVQRKDIRGDHQGEEKIDFTLKTGERERFKFLASALPDNQLAKAAEEVMTTLETEHTKEEAEKKKKGGVLSFIFGTKNVSHHGHESFMEQDFDLLDEEELSEKVLSFGFSLKEGSITVISRTFTRTEEGINLQLYDLAVDFSLRSKGSNLQSSLNNIIVNLITRTKGSNQFELIPVLQRIDRYSGVLKPFLSVRMDQNPPDKEPGLYVDLNSEPFNLTYHPSFIARLISFKDLDSRDEDLKRMIKLKLERLNEQAKNAATDFYEAEAKVKQILNINFAAPSIIIPFDPKDRIMCACWVVDLGELNIGSRDPKVKLDENYLIYLMSLNDISFQYYPTVRLLHEYQEARIVTNNKDTKKPQGFYDLIENFSVKIDFRHARNRVKAQIDNVPKTAMEIEISEVYAKITPELLIDFIKLPTYLDLPKRRFEEIAEKESWKLTDQIEKSGFLSCQDRLLNPNVTAWSNYYVTIVKNHMFFFNNFDSEGPVMSIDLRLVKLYTDSTDPRTFTV